MSTARATLTDIAARLAPFGRVRILFGATVELDGSPVLTVNASDALVLSPVYEGTRMVLRAENVRVATSPADIAALILQRTAGRRAA